MLTSSPTVVLNSKKDGTLLLAVVQHFQAWTASFVASARRAGVGEKVEQRLAQLDLMIDTLRRHQGTDADGDVTVLQWVPSEVDLCVQACDSYVERLRELQCIAELVGHSASDDPHAFADLQQLLHDVGRLKEELLKVSRRSMPTAISQFFAEESPTLVD